MIDDLRYKSIKMYIHMLYLTYGGYHTKGDKLMRGRGVSQAYDLLFDNKNNFKSYDEIEQIIIIDRSITHTNLVRVFMEKAMNKKFENDYFKDILVSTYPLKLYWNDKSDPVLGIGNDKQYKGKNYIGLFLEDIRSRIIEYRKTNPYPIINSVKEVVRLFQTDSFLNKWIEMRTLDICKVISKFRQYIFLTHGKIIDANEKLINYIIDHLYQPCSVVSNIKLVDNITVPEYFKRLVQTSPGLEMVIKRDYQKEIDDIREEIDILTSQFEGIPYKSYRNPKKKDIDIQKYLEIQNQKYQKYLQENKDISKEDKKKYLERMEKEISLITRAQSETKVELPIKRELEFENNLRKEWKQFIEKLLSEEQKSIEEQNMKIKEFSDSMEVKRSSFYPHKKQLKSKEDVKNYESIKREKENMIYNIIKEQQIEIQEYYKIVFSISEIIYKRFLIIFQYIIDNMDIKNTQKIKNIILRSTNDISNIYDKSVSEVDRITESIFKVILKIKNFKSLYSIKTNLDKEDIDLAVSIILNKDYTKKKIKYDISKVHNPVNYDEDYQGEEVKEDEEKNYQEEEVKEDEDEEDYQEDEYEDEYEGEDYEEEEVKEDEDEYEEDDYQGDDYQGDDYQEEEEFGFGKNEDIHIDRIQTILVQIFSENELTDLEYYTDYIIDKIYFILKFKTNSGIKWNRINFFSNLVL